MGRTKQSKQVSQDMFKQYNTSQQNWNDYNNRLNPLVVDARNRATDMYNTTKTNYEKYLSGFGHGAFLPTDENISRMRGGGVFDEYAKTGGMNAMQRQDFRSRGIATMGSFYDGLRGELTRARSLNGGVDPGYDAQQAKLTRDAAQGAQQQATSTEVALNDQINQGREWGASQMSDAEKAVVDAIERAKEFDANGQLAGTKGLESLYTDTPGEVNMYEQLMQRGMEDRDTSGLNSLNQLASYTPNGNWFDRNRRLLGILGSIASVFAPQIAPVAKAVASGSDSSYTNGAGSYGFGPHQGITDSNGRTIGE